MRRPLLETTFGEAILPKPNSASPTLLWAKVCEITRYSSRASEADFCDGLVIVGDPETGPAAGYFAFLTRTALKRPICGSFPASGFA
jgi:hypothetical protein